MEIKSVIQQANTLLEAQRYSSSRIYGYNWLWKKGILSYMKARGITEFDETVGADFIQTMHDGGTVTFSHRDLIKSVDVLINIVRNGTLAFVIHEIARTLHFAFKSSTKQQNQFKLTRDISPITKMNDKELYM